MITWINIEKIGTFPANGSQVLIRTKNGYTAMANFREDYHSFTVDGYPECDYFCNPYPPPFKDGNFENGWIVTHWANFNLPDDL